MESQLKIEPTLLVLDDKRVERRRELYLGEGIDLKIRKDAEDFSGHTISLSANGMGIALEKNEQNSKLQIADKIVLSPEIPGYEEEIAINAIITNIQDAILSQKPCIRIGVIYENEKRDVKSHFFIDTRKSMRFQTSLFFKPVVFAEHPLFFRESLHFQVQCFSLKGFELLTSARNKSFFPGMPLKMTVQIPLLGSFQVNGVIKNVRVSNDTSDRYHIGVEYKKIDENYMPAVSEYLVASAGVNLSELRENNFPVDNIEKALHFGYPENEADWQAILQLRFDAYKAAGKFGSAQTPADMTDEYDKWARHIVCRVNGKIVGCNRLVFSNGTKDRSEHAKLGINMPEFLGSMFVESSRACTDQNFRGSDLFINMLRHCGRIVYQSGYKYMVFNCNDNMKAMYEKAGSIFTGVKFDAFGTTGCNLMYLDLPRLVGGRGGGLFGWHLITYPMARYLAKRRKKNRLYLRLKLLFHRRSNPILNKLINSSRRKSQKSRNLNA